MVDLEGIIRAFGAGRGSVAALTAAAEQTPGSLGDRTLALLNEYNNSDHEFTEVELRRRAGALLAT